MTGDRRRICSVQLRRAKLCSLIAHTTANALHNALAARGAFANIRQMPNRVRHFPFDAELYKARNAVKRFFNKLKHFRGRRHPIR